MKITSLELVNYRNYENQKLQLVDGLNILIGNNAQGKTNLLESIFLCSIGKSPRTNKDKDLILWEKDLAKVTLNSVKLQGNKKIEMYLSKNTNKTIKINGIVIKKIGELMGEFNSVYFSPDEMKLVKESPDERRRFMDICLSQFDKNYFYTLNKYNNILQQRNKLLKTEHSKKVVLDTIYIWNAQLAKCASFIVNKRLFLMEKLKVFANDAINYITDNKESMVLTYTGQTETDTTKLEQLFMELYEKSLDKDMSLGYTTVGPHRDDFKIVVNDIDVRSFGSQGQQRTSALALKLAELEVFKEYLGEYPVLLLDDVLSELDEERQLKLLNKVSGIQTVITCTHFPFNIAHKRFVVNNGSVVEENFVK